MLKLLSAFVLALLAIPAVAQAGVITVQLTPSITGVAPGRDRPGTPLLHLDFITGPATSNVKFLIDSIATTPSGPTFDFDSTVEGWFNEPEEPTISVFFEASGIDGGSLGVSPTGPRDAWELERAYDASWNATPNFYSSITLKFDIPSPFELRGVDFRIDDGTTGALYSFSSGGTPPPGVVPEPTSLAIFGIGALGMVGTRRRRKRA